LQERCAVAQALEPRHGAEGAEALFLGPQRRLPQRQAAAVHQQQAQERLRIADPSGAAKTATLPRHRFQIRRKHPANELPRLLEGKSFQAPKGYPLRRLNAILKLTPMGQAPLVCRKCAKRLKDAGEVESSPEPRSSIGSRTRPRLSFSWFELGQFVEQDGLGEPWKLGDKVEPRTNALQAIQP
jgi:hypothetical protein